MYIPSEMQRFIRSCPWLFGGTVSWENLLCLNSISVVQSRSRVSRVWLVFSSDLLASKVTKSGVVPTCAFKSPISITWHVSSKLSSDVIVVFFQTFPGRGMLILLGECRQHREWRHTISYQRPTPDGDSRERIISTLSAISLLTSTATPSRWYPASLSICNVSLESVHSYIIGGAKFNFC